MKEDLTDIKVIQAKQEENLKEHMRRSLANEEAVEALKNQLIPIQKHVDSVSTILKFIGVIGTAITVVAGLIKIINFIY